MQWDVSIERVAFYFGRPPDTSLIENPDPDRGNWDEPFEDPAEGCPRGWATSPFVMSVLRYYRRRDKQSNRVRNPLFDDADWLVQQAVMLLEHYEEKWYAAVDAVIFKPREK